MGLHARTAARITVIKGRTHARTHGCVHRCGRAWMHTIACMDACVNPSMDASTLACMHGLWESVGRALRSAPRSAGRCGRLRGRQGVARDRSRPDRQGVAVGRALRGIGRALRSAGRCDRQGAKRNALPIIGRALRSAPRSAPRLGVARSGFKVAGSVWRCDRSLLTVPREFGKRCKRFGLRLE